MTALRCRLRVTPVIIDIAIGLLALTVYLATLAPTITWRNEGADSGDLATAAYTLGIPHPPGYPLFTLVASVFAHLPVGEPAQNVGLFSALAGAGAVVLLARAVRMVAKMGGQRKFVNLIAPSVALLLAFAPPFWSQTVVAEIYALSVLFAVAFFVVLLSNSPRPLYLAAGILGVGLAHHLTIILLVPGALVLLAESRWSRAQVAKSSFFFLLPLLFYLYLPLRASTHPPMNWGDPETWQNFWWTVSGAAYRPYLFALGWSDMFTRVQFVAHSLFDSFSIWGVALGLWGAIQMAANPTARVRRLLWAMLLMVMLLTAYAVVYNSRNSFVYLLFPLALFSIWIAFAIGDLASRVSRRWQYAPLIASLLFLPAFNLVSNYQAMDLSHDKTAFDFAQQVMTAVPRDAVVVANGDEHLFALWYYRYVVAGDSSRVSIVGPALLQYDWYYSESCHNLERVCTATNAELQTPPRMRLEQIVDGSLTSGRTVYSVDAGAWLANYVYQQTGNLYWVRIRKSN